ncbi:MAG: LLM class flavin-dependent oxidoreductase [candidate division NC10 bacterium]
MTALRVGITTMATEPPERFRALVRAVDEGGFDELWVCDALESRRLAFGPNCTHPYTRHPSVTLNAMATLHELSGGRARLAVGAGDRPVTELGYRMASVAKVREMIGVVRAAAGLHVPLPSPLPVYVSASGPRMLALGGELADGVLFFSGVHPPCVEWALARIRSGARGAGRDPAALDVGCTLAGSLGDDADLARRECVPMAAWFPQTAPHYAELAGVSEEVTGKIRAAYAGGHFDGAEGAFGHVTDAMIDRFTVAGPAELWVQRIKEVAALGVSHVNIFLLSRDKLAMVRDLAARVLPHVRNA